VSPLLLLLLLLLLSPPLDKTLASLDPFIFLSCSPLSVSPWYGRVVSVSALASSSATQSTSRRGIGVYSLETCNWGCLTSRLQTAPLRSNSCSFASSAEVAAGDDDDGEMLSEAPGVKMENTPLPQPPGLDLGASRNMLESRVTASRDSRMNE